MTGPMRRIHMGFAQKLENVQAITALQRHYLPLGKIGGKPAWLNPEHPLTGSQVTCSVCSQVMSFVLQIYSGATPVHAFHRYLYVFMCKNPACQAHNNSRNFKMFRCQLPRENSYYLSDRKLTYEIDGAIPDPCFDAKKFAKLCIVCGISAKSYCAKCQVAWYCCRQHQAVDWREGHKTRCQKAEADGELEDEPKNSAMLFTEFGITMDFEDVPENFDSDGDGDDDDDDDSDEEEGDGVEDVTLKMKNLLSKYDPKNAMSELNELEESERDGLFRRFRRELDYNPDQVLRYDRGGKPLLATSHSVMPTSIPNCQCGAKRQFEFQLTPYLISLLDLDSLGESVDFATVLFYSCSDFCKIEKDGYAEEYVFKQDYKEVDPDGATLTTQVEDEKN